MHAMDDDVAIEDRPDEAVDRLLGELRMSVGFLAERLGCRLVAETDSGLAWLAGAGTPIVADGPPASRRSQERPGKPVPIGLRDRKAGTVWCEAPAGDPALQAALMRSVELVVGQAALREEEQRLLEALSSCWEHLEGLQEYTACTPLARTTDDFVRRIFDSAGGAASGTSVALWIGRGAKDELLVCRPVGRPWTTEVDPEWVVRAFGSGRCRSLNDRAKIAAWAPGGPSYWAKAARLLIVPVETRLGTRGLLLLWNERPGPAYDSHLVRQVRALARQAILAVEVDRLDRAALEGELLRQELEIGARLQQTLLSGPPPECLPKLRIACVAEASQKVGGDFVEIFRESPTSVAVMLGDVMGKGLKAAITGVTASRQFHKVVCNLMSRHSASSPDPERVVSTVARDLVPYLMEIESFVTAVYARIDHRRGRLDFVDCGHPPMLHYSRDTGRCTVLRGESMPLGFTRDDEYRQVSVPFRPGDIFVLYSDGLTEAYDPGLGQFGLERLTGLVEAHAGFSEPDEIVRVIRASVEQFAGRKQLDDDFTCVVAQIEGEVESAEPRAGFVLEIDSDLTRLDELRRFTRAVCTRCAGPAPDADWVAELELAVTEAASNIMIHGYGGRTDCWIRAEAAADEDRVEIRLVHAGRNFDPSKVKTPHLDGSEDGGFGVYLIGKCVDDVTYDHDESGARWTVLTKRRPGTFGCRGGNENHMGVVRRGRRHPPGVGPT